MADRVVNYAFTGSFTNLIGGLTAAGRATADLGTKLTALDKNGVRARAGLTAIGTTAGRVGLVAAAGLGAIVVASANFEQAMSNVAATGQDARDSFDELREAAIKAGADTAFSASEAAAGIENLLKAGVSAKDVLAGGLSGALDLAAAGQLEVADAAEIAATAMTQFKLAGEDIPHVADLLAAGAGKAQGDVSDLAMALKQSGLVASQMGISIEETTGTLAAFAANGLLGSDAGTSFRTMLLRLANPTQESAALMEELGIQAYDAQGNFVGMASVAEQLKVAFEGKTQAERDSALATIFGSDAIRAASVLYSQGSAGVEMWTANVNDAGYAAETAATRLDNLKGDLEALRGSLETALIGAGDGSEGPLRKMVQGLTDVINLVNKLPSSAQGVASSLLAVTAVTGGALWFGSKVIGGVASTRKALDDLSAVSPRAARGLSLVAKAGLTLAALEVGTAIIDSLRDAAKGAAPDVEELSAALSAVDAEALQDSLGGSLSDLLEAADSGALENFGVKVGETVDSLGLAGDAIDVIVPGLHSTQDQASKTAEALESLDQALATLAATEGPERAEAALRNLAEAEGLSAGALSDLIDLLPSYRAATGDAAGETDKLAGTQNFLNQFFKTGAASADDMARSLDGLADSAHSASDAMNQLAGFLDRADAMQAYGDAIKATTKALKDGFDPKDKEIIRGIGREIIGVAETLAKKPAQQRSFLKQAKDDLEGFIATNPKAKAALGDLLKYVNRGLKDLDNSEANPKLGARDEEFKGKQKRVRSDLAWLDHAQVNPLVGLLDRASAPLRNIKSLLDQLHSKTITVTTRQALIHSPDLLKAQGGPIVGPGGPTSDDVPIMGSNGEFMMKAAAVRHYGLNTMFAMNAMRLASGGLVNMTHAKRLAGGGSVTGGNTAVLEMFNNLNDDEVERRRRATSGVIDILERERDSRLKMLEEEKQAIADRMSALREERRAIMESVDARLADIFATTGKTAADFMGDTTGMTSLQIYQQQQFAEQIADSSQQSPIDILQGNIKDLGELKRLIAQLRKMGLKGDALTALIQSASNDQIQQLLADGEAQHYAQLYNQQQQFSHQVGNQAANAVGVTAELRGLVKENRQIKAELQRLNHRQRKAENQRDEQTRATRQVGGDVANAMSSRSRTASRRATR